MSNAIRLCIARIGLIAILLVAGYRAQAIEPCSSTPNRFVSYGSDKMRVLVEAWANDLKRRLPDLDITIRARGSGVAIAKLIDCENDIGPMSRPPTREEIDHFERRFGYPPTVVEVAIEALAVYVHEDNPVDRTTLDKLDAVYSSGRKCGYYFDLDTWDRLSPQFGAIRPIRRYGRDRYSHAHHFFRTTALCDGDFKPGVRIKRRPEALIEAVAADPDAIGYAEMTHHARGVKALILARSNGDPFVPATPRRAADGSYPLARPLYIAVNRPPSDEPLPRRIQIFMEIALSAPGQRAAREVGYVGLGEDRLRESRRLLGLDKPRSPGQIESKPPPDTRASVADLGAQVAYQRAFEAVIWSMPAVAKYGIYRAAREIGAGDGMVIAWSGPASAKMQALTPDATAPYAMATIDLRDGPMVVEIPRASSTASLYGQIADHRSATIADIGTNGIDEGQGARLLVTPPGYRDPPPLGYVEVASPTSHRVDLVLRAIPTLHGTARDAYALSRRIRIYRLADLPNPGPTRFIDPIDTRWSSLPRYDERWFEDLNELLEFGPTLERDKVMMGALKTLGIEPGKPFAPDATTQTVLRRAAIDAYHYMRERTLEFDPHVLYWADRHWRTVHSGDLNNGFDWDLGPMLDYDSRAIHPWFRTAIVPSRVRTWPPVASLSAIRDKSGKLLKAGGNYRLRVPSDVPAEHFWSLTVYDMESGAFIDNPYARSSLSSREQSRMTRNDDGSVTLYVGPDEPRNLEHNWIPSGGKTPYLIFRLYGAEDAFYDGSFKLPDVE